MAPDSPRIEFSQRAVRDVRKMAAKDRRAVRDALDELANGAKNLDVRERQEISAVID